MLFGLSAYTLLRWIKYWPPLLGAGIKVDTLSKDMLYCKTVLKYKWWNKNVVGVQYGGSLFSLTDPFYMLMLMVNLSSKEYIIWDKSAFIQYIKPGKSAVYAEFKLTPEQLVAMRKEVKAAGGQKDFEFNIDIKSCTNDTLIARVKKVIYVKVK